MNCPACSSTNTFRALSFGLPMKLCNDCNCGWGLAAWVHEQLDSLFGVSLFTGELVVYEPGGYWRALWHWLWGHGE